MTAKRIIKHVVHQVCQCQHDCALQVCQQDPQYNSYVEMPIVCRSATRNYTHVEAVTVLRPGRDLGRTLGPDVDDIVIGSFYSPDGAGSALGMFQLRDVRSKAAENRRHCSESPHEFVGKQFVWTNKAAKCSEFHVSIGADGVPLN